MTTPPTGSTINTNKPARALLKRIDIGLTTGVVAVLVAFLSLLVARSQTKMALENDTPIETIDAFDAAIMNGRMRSNVGFPVTAPAAGFLRAGDSIEPRRYRMGAAGSELGAYLRGDFGTPLDGLDLDVCYCSVFKDCWTVSHANRQLPKPVNSCGIKDTPVDYFQTYIDQTAAKRLEK